MNDWMVAEALFPKVSPFSWIRPAPPPHLPVLCHSGQTLLDIFGHCLGHCQRNNPLLPGLSLCRETMRGIGKAFDVSAICPSLLAQLSAHSSYSRWFRHLGKPELWELAIKELLAFLTRWTFQTNQSSKTRHVIYARNVLSIQQLSSPFIQKATIQIQIQIRLDRKRSTKSEA